jgi:outer membrane receptor protein involved in Fe transport
MPNLQFGGQPANVVDARFGNIPYENFNTIYSFVDNISKVWGNHTLKSGIYVERTRKYQVGGRNPRGAFDFTSNVNNPFDTRNSFSNALVGVFNSYSEGTARVNGDWRFWNVEWFVQDNWRVTNRLTLDLGLRFYHLPPQVDENKTIATFGSVAV